MHAKLLDALLGLVLSGLAATVSVTAFAQPKPKGDEPAPDPYTQHMRNGIQLYELKHYGPAIIEFDAAYDAKPAASPLINKALCYREQMKYPQAVAALKKALGEHGATLDPATRAAAQKAIDEMSPLIAYVRLKVDPPDAVTEIDGEVLVPDENGELQLAPNEHTISITRDGYDAFGGKFTIVSGQHIEYARRLESRLGTLDVFAPKDDVDIEIDGKTVGRGHWAGPLEKGSHAVRFGSDKDPVAVTLTAQATTVLDRRESAKPAPDTTPKPKPPATTPEATGFYVFVQGGTLYPTRLPEAFRSKDGQLQTLSEAANYFGALAGLRAGYRLNTYAAFEGNFDYSNVTGGREESSVAGKDPAEYSFSSWRIGPFLRLMSPGKIGRFVGAIGGGFAIHSTSFANVEEDVACQGDPNNPLSRPQCSSGWGVDFFFTADAGVEFNIGHVILGARLEFAVDGTKGAVDYDNANDGKDLNPFDNDPLAFIGPVAHFGYSTW